MGVFALLAGILMRRWWAMPAVAALWVAIEATHGPLGFAWLALGNAGIDMGLPMRLAPFTSVYGLSFVFVLMSAGAGARRSCGGRAATAVALPLPLLSLLPALPAAERGRETARRWCSRTSPKTQEWTPETLSTACSEQPGPYRCAAP